MNRCEEVLKHSTNKGLKIETDELYHSDTYLGSEYDEGLKHWKYIKRYWGKGRWNYVYANKETHDTIKRANNTAVDAYRKADPRSNGDGTYTAGNVGELKRARRTINFRDAVIEKNTVKSKVSKVAKAVKDIHKDSVKRGTDFIEKLLSKFK